MRKKVVKYSKFFVKHYHLKIGRFLASHGASEYTILVIFSVILGTLAGLAAVCFHETIEIFTHFSHSTGKIFSGSFPWIIISIPMLGMLLQWLMTRLAPKQAKQKGVLEVIKSVSMRNGKIPFKTTLFHFLAPAICIGTGGTVGPEAPAAQTGAGTVAAVGELLGISESKLKIFTAAGAGAAIAAVFNTPLAGIFFAIEVILLNDIHASALSAFLLSSVSASAVSRAILGNEPRFHFGHLELGSYDQFFYYLLLGVLAGFLSVAFIKSNEWVKDKFQKLYKKFPVLPVMLIVGLAMGIAGYFLPELFGIGYNCINNLLFGMYSIKLVTIFFVFKFVLVLLILNSGGFGGIFAPSIFLGACYGYLFALVFSSLFHIPLDYVTYTLVGMGAMLAGVNSVPITAIMILFEMTNNYYFILPLMLGIVGSHIVTQMIMNGSIYSRELLHAGFHAGFGKDTTILRSISIDKVIRRDILTLTDQTPVSQVVREFLNTTHDTIYTTDNNNRITGVITSASLQHLITDFDNLQQVLIAKDIADNDICIIHAHESLEHALRLFGRYRVEEIPVVYQEDESKPLGTLHYQDVLNAYNQMAAKMNLKDGLANDFKSLQTDQILEVMPGFSMAETKSPDKFIGKNLAQLKLRNLYRIDVLMIERKDVFSNNKNDKQQLMPDKNFVFKRGDRLIIYGRTLDVLNFKNISSGN